MNKWTNNWMEWTALMNEIEEWMNGMDECINGRNEWIKWINEINEMNKYMNKCIKRSFICPGTYILVTMRIQASGWAWQQDSKLYLQLSMAKGYLRHKPQGFVIIFVKYWPILKFFN